mgnify:CR=1 FL=1
MKKRNVFSRQAVNILWILLGVGAIFQFIEVIWAVSKGYFGFFHMMMFIVMEIVAVGSVCVLIYEFLIKPYKQARDVFEHFIDSGNFRELLDQGYQIFPEQNRVMQKLDSILDEKNIIELSTKHAELLALQNQINPHFLYNTLEAIRGDALCEGVDSIADTTEALSTFFRYTITNTGNLVSVEDELENVENYFKIQQYRFGDKLDMKVNFPDDYSRILECKLPKLTLQPVVENAIFHGLEAKAEGGVITISMEMTEKKLLINIHDNGIGINEEELIKINQRLEAVSGPLKEEKRKRGGIALPNVSRRIKLLFGEEYGIHIYSIPNLGTEVRIAVPIIANREYQNP